MMRCKNILTVVLTLVVAAVILSSSGSAVALEYDHSYEDEKGDVKEEPLADVETVDEPDIDILKVETKKENDMVVFTMKVDGNIVEDTGDENVSIGYTFHVMERGNLSAIYEEPGLTVAYGDGNGSYSVWGDSNISDAQPVIEGGKLTLKVPVEEFSDLNEFHFIAVASKDIMGTDTGGGVDILRSWEQTESDEDKDDEGIPGFETMVLITGLSSAMAIYAFRKNE
ncbi:MAG: hypothetical protein R6U61_07090 [Thermoplasmata archaeon]